MRTTCVTCGKKLTAEEANAIGECFECLAKAETAGIAKQHEAMEREHKKGHKFHEALEHANDWALASTVSALTMVAKERYRQTEVEGYTPAHDDAHVYGELALAAIAYATPDDVEIGREVFVDNPPGSFMPRRVRYESVWPWEGEPKRTTRIRDLVKAGALIAAEIDRLLRLEAKLKEIPK